MLLACCVNHLNIITEFKPAVFKGSIQWYKERDEFKDFDDMEFNKHEFFRAIDVDEHFNAKTREAYWDFFEEQCDWDIKTLYHKGAALYPGKEGLHQYVQYSLDKFLQEQSLQDKKPEPAEQQKTQEAKQPGESQISPIDREWKKKPAATWGSNDDVKFK